MKLLPFKTLDEKLKLIDDKNIIIAADKLVTTGKLNNILIKLNKNKISNVTLLSNEK
jgi:biopolymer transport protein ExbD